MLWFVLMLWWQKSIQFNSIQNERFVVSYWIYNIIQYLQSVNKNIYLFYLIIYENNNKLANKIRIVLDMFQIGILHSSMVYAAFASLKYRLSPLATRTVGIASLKELIDSFENVRTIPADSKADMMFSLVELCWTPDIMRRMESACSESLIESLPVVVKRFCVENKTKSRGWVRWLEWGTKNTVLTPYSSKLKRSSAFLWHEKPSRMRMAGPS